MDKGKYGRKEGQKKKKLFCFHERLIDKRKYGKKEGQKKRK
jgi:hypothetical protein